MEKNLNINLSGINFFIEESAYTSLRKYLDTVKTHFANFEDFAEIYKDIETRISEMFSQRLTTNKNVITSGDVDEVIRIMGNPAEFSSAEKEKNNAPASESKGPKRMFRETEHRVLGGICSGLAVYFGIDSVWLRLAFFFSLFLGGFGALLYIVLWIALPKPRSISERLEMKGDPVNLSSIESAIKKNLSIKEDGKAENLFTKIILFPFRALSQILEGLWYILKKIVPGLGKALCWIAGILIMFIMLILGVVLTFTLGLGLGLFYFNDIHFLHLTDNWLQITGLISTYFLILIPVLFIFLSGLWLIRGKVVFFRKAGLTMLILWIISLSGSIFAFSGIVPEFSEKSTVQKNIALDFSKYQTIYLRVNEEGQSHYYNTKLYIQPSENDSTELICKYIARGVSRKVAKENARQIIYEVSRKDSVLWFQSNFILPEDAFFRLQQVELILKVPADKLINFDNKTENLMAESPDTEDYDEAQYHDLNWRVTEDGLVCNNNPVKKHHLNRDERIKIKFKLRELKSELRNYRNRLKEKLKNDESLDEIKESLEEINDNLKEVYEDIENVPVSDLKETLNRMKEKVKNIVREHKDDFDLLENLDGIEIIINSDRKEDKKEKKIIVGDSIVIKI